MIGAEIAGDEYRVDFQRPSDDARGFRRRWNGRRWRSGLSRGHGIADLR